MARPSIGRSVDLLVDHLDHDAYVKGVPRVEAKLEALLGVAVDRVTCTPYDRRSPPPGGRSPRERGHGLEGRHTGAGDGKDGLRSHRRCRAGAAPYSAMIDR